MPVQLVWLKRDLRLVDHAPLAQAAARGPTCILYAYEPELWAQPESAACHLHFIDASLRELDDKLRDRGGRLTYRVGAMPELLAQLADALTPAGGIAALWSHQETGTGWTFTRDKAVARWCRAQGIPWHEFGQDGVNRPHPKRDGWARRWTEAMRQPLVAAPSRIFDVATVVPGWRHEGPRSAAELGLQPFPDELQAGGSAAAKRTLSSFLRRRGRDYPRAMSSPLSAWDGCSRLSPHLAWGTISTRLVWQQVRGRLRSLANDPRPPARAWRESLDAFESRLRWRGHFMQKLEDEPALEFRNLQRSLDGLREPDWDDGRFAAWCAGQTGYPLIDACMRSLVARKWLNFRMRAMLVSFASYHLWLHWREPARFLARQFLDFEAGIHFSQMQMQAGTTGINSLRIYDPIKQSRDQDPDGAFIRRWVPELEAVPTRWIHDPHAMPSEQQAACGVRIGRDYPAPLVENGPAAVSARRRLEARRRSDPARREAERVYQRHGSRMPAPRRRWR